MKINRRPTQAARILEYIRVHGSITSLEAADELRITCLPQRVFELREAGYRIEHTKETTRHVDGKTVQYFRYFLKVDEEEQEETETNER